MKRCLMWKIIQTSLFFVAVIAGIISLLFLVRLDTIVHVKLYDYGLRFSLEWANEYWMYLNRVFLCIGIIFATSILGFLILYLVRPNYYPINNHTELPTRKLNTIINLTLVSIGIITLITSIVYASSILAFIGLGLTFWGFLFNYIRSDDFISKKLLDYTLVSSHVILNQILCELGFEGPAIYLPPEYLTDFKSNMVFIPKKRNASLPAFEKMQKQKGIFMKEPEAILIELPCSNRTKLFEKNFTTKLIHSNLTNLESNLQCFLIEDLEIAENIEIEIDDNSVYAKIVNSIYQDICTEVEKTSILSFSLIYPICSIIACVITKVTRKPVVIEELTKSDDAIINVKFRLLGK